MGYQSDSFSLGLFSISNQKIGAIFLFLSIILEIVRKKMGQKINTFGGGSAKRIHSISIVISTVLIILPGIISWLFNSQSTLSAGSWIHFIEAFSFSFFILFVIHFYFESLVPSPAKSSNIYSLLSLSVPFFILFLLESSAAEFSISFPTFLAFLFIAFGITSFSFSFSLFFPPSPFPFSFSFLFLLFSPFPLLLILPFTPFPAVFYFLLANPSFLLSLLFPLFVFPSLFYPLRFPCSPLSFQSFPLL